MDRYHNNIKRLDLSSGEWKVSTVFTRDEDPKVVDIQAVDDLVYVSNRADSIYVLDSSLSVKNVIAIPPKFFRSQQVFLRLPGGSVDLYCPPEKRVVRVDSERAVISSDTMLLRAGIAALKGRTFSIATDADSTDWYVQLPSKKWLRLKEPIPDITEMDGYRFAANDRYFTYFNIEPKKVAIYLYEL